MAVRYAAESARRMIYTDMMPELFVKIKRVDSPS